MNPETFFDNFGMLADVPDGVSKLRGLILQLAVQGKLVPQDENDENDEPASVLLEKIKAEKERLVKERLVKEKKIKKSKPVSSNDVENLYELSANWIWTRLFDIGIINPRNKASDDIDASFVPMTLISETYSTPVSSERRQWGEIKTGFTHFAEEDVVLAKITPCFQNGKSAVMRNLLNGFGAGTTELHVFRPLLGESVYPDYVLLYLKSPQFLTEGIEKMTGTAGQKRVTRDYFAGNPFPLPPFEEQKRIVAKVDQLMTLCDELEARQQKKQEARLRLNSAALDKLLTAHEPAEFAHHWQRVCDNFDLLYDNPETVGELRKAILQLAVQGKLVRQDANDEPAPVLVEKIKDEKDRLIKEKKIMNKMALPDIEVNDLPCKLPNGWASTWLGKCIDLISGQHLGQDEQNDRREGLPYLTGPADFGKINPVATRWTSNPKVISEINDILITVKGAGVGKANIQGMEKAAIGRQLMAIRPICLENRYVYLLINASFEKFQALSTGSTVPGIRREDILQFAVGIPPLEEQRRIVARVDQLMALCDELEAKLRQSQTDGAKLMEAVVHKLVAA